MGPSGDSVGCCQVSVKVEQEVGDLLDIAEVVDLSGIAEVVGLLIVEYR